MTWGVQRSGWIRKDESWGEAVGRREAELDGNTFLSLKRRCRAFDRSEVRYGVCNTVITTDSKVDEVVHDVGGSAYHSSYVWALWRLPYLVN